MIISTREAFMGKKQRDLYKPTKSGWILVREAGKDFWSDEIKDRVNEHGCIMNIKDFYVNIDPNDISISFINFSSDREFSGTRFYNCYYNADKDVLGFFTTLEVKTLTERGLFQKLLDYAYDNTNWNRSTNFVQAGMV